MKKNHFDVDEEFDREVLAKKNVLNTKEAMFFVGLRRTKFAEERDKGLIKGIYNGRWRYPVTQLIKYMKLSEAS